MIAVWGGKLVAPPETHTSWWYKHHCPANGYTHELVVETPLSKCTELPVLHSKTASNGYAPSIKRKLWPVGMHINDLHDLLEAVWWPESKLPHALTSKSCSPSVCNHWWRNWAGLVVLILAYQWHAFANLTLKLPPPHLVCMCQYVP